MKKILLILMGCCGLMLSSNAQTSSSTQLGCGAMGILNAQIQQDTMLARRMQNMETKIQEYIAQKNALRNQGNLRITDPEIIIPIVFHVLLPNPTVSFITESQINDQVAKLESHFNGTHPNPASYNSTWDYDRAGNTKIKFCRTLPTIRKYATPDPTTQTYTYKRGDLRISTESQGVSNYLNVWIVDLNDPNHPDLGGYAYFPTTVGPTQDGIVLDYQVFGTTTANSAYQNFPGRNGGKTLTHEVGHWLGLNHPWGESDTNTDCNDIGNSSDGIADTPKTFAPTTGCPSISTAKCAGVTTMFQNFMDYADDDCKYLFTKGQADRMYAHFETFGGRRDILSSPGCNPTAVTCPKPVGLEILVQQSGNQIKYRLHWAINKSVNPIPSSFTVYKRLSGQNNFSLEAVSVMNGAAQGRFYADITGLTGGQSYDFKVNYYCSSTSASIESEIYEYIPAVNSLNIVRVGELDTYNSTNQQPEEAIPSHYGETPYGTYYQSQKVQYILTKQQIYDSYILTQGVNNPVAYNIFKCYIKSLSFDFSVLGTPLHNFSIKMKEIDPAIEEFTETAKDMSDSDGEFMSMNGGTTVYNVNLFEITNPTPTLLDKQHVFMNPFVYSGNNNLLIELTFNNPVIPNNVNTHVKQIQPHWLNWDPINGWLDTSSPYNDWKRILKQTIIYGADQDVRNATKGRLLEWRPVIGFDLTTF